MLNHISGSFGGVAGIYNRYTYFEEMKAAAGAYELHLQELVGFSAPPSVAVSC